MAQASIFEQILDPASRANPYPLYARAAQDAGGAASTTAATSSARTARSSRCCTTRGSAPTLAAAPRLADTQTGGRAARAAAGLHPPRPARARPAAGAGDPAVRATLHPRPHRRHAPLAGGGHRRPDRQARRQEPRRPRRRLRLPAAGDRDLRAARRPRSRTSRASTGGPTRSSRPLTPTTGTFAERPAQAQPGRTPNSASTWTVLADARARQPGDDLISGLLTDSGGPGPMSREDLLSSAALLLVAGHETTVNLITNGMLTLLRHPDMLERLSREPGPGNPAGRGATALRASGADSCPAAPRWPTSTSRAPPSPRIRRSSWCLPPATGTPAASATRTASTPDRTDNQHLGFGGGIHYCFGAALARNGGAGGPARSLPAGWSTPGWWPTRRPTGPTRYCAAPATSRSPTTQSRRPPSRRARELARSASQPGVACSQEAT